MARASGAREAVLVVVAVVLLALSIYFFMNSLNFMTQQPPRVAASLLAALLGLATLASSVTLFRVWILSRAMEGGREGSQAR